jgi:hypothetical protein
MFHWPDLASFSQRHGQGQLVKRIRLAVLVNLPPLEAVVIRAEDRILVNVQDAPRGAIGVMI